MQWHESIYLWPSFNLCLFVIGALDFFLRARTSERLYHQGFFYAVVICNCLFVFLTGFTCDAILYGLLTSGLFVFAYVNAIAFLKRGVTFAILEYFAYSKTNTHLDKLIDLEMRVQEMAQHGWIRSEPSQFVISKQGYQVLGLYRLLSRILRLEQVG